VLDRESTFADPEIVKMLKTQFVPVAIDQAYQRRQQDTEGDFYRKIAAQSPRSDFNGTTQGFYIATAAGKLLLYNNNRDPAKVRRLMQERLLQFQASPAARAEIAPVEASDVDARYNPRPPVGGLVVRVNAKILDGYEATTDRWRRIFQTAISRDNLWVSRAEHETLLGGKVPASLQQRIARYHLVDNTRGEPPMWRPDEIRAVSMRIEGTRIIGSARLATANGGRGYDAELLGEIEVADDKVVRLDLVALGQFWGEGAYTRGAPEGKFPLAIAFTLADGSDVADSIPPQGSRGWVQGYMQ
jgi:hypothetical protein